MATTKKVSIKSSKKTDSSKNAPKKSRKPKKFTQKMKDDLEKEIEEFEAESEDLNDKEEIPLFTDKDDDLSPEEIEEKKKKITKAIKRPMNLYRKIALLFIFLTCALLVAVFYFSFVKLTITIMPKQEVMADNIIIDIKDQSKNLEIPQEAIVGIVEQVSLETEKMFTATGEEIIGEDLTGKVTIINNLNVAQPLVATTRLLGPDNKLFRIKETVTAPAKGQVEVDIYADDISQEMAIGPTKFTIPGLRADKQDKIYAESKTAFVYANKTKSLIKQSDIDGALAGMEKELINKARQEFGDVYKGFDQVIYSIDDSQLETSVSDKAGTEKDEFSVKAKTKVNVIAFKAEDVSKKAELRLISGLPQNKELINFYKDEITYELNTYDIASGTATVNAFFKGETKIKQGSDIVSSEKVVGLTKDQLTDYLKSFPEIQSFQITFTPSFLKKAPSLADRIKIEIAK